MNLRVLAFSVSLFTLLSYSVRAQETTSDAQGVAFLTQTLNAVGGAQALATVQDFTATGTITYYWAGEAVQAPATVKVKGGHRFRLDAKLPEGTRTWVINYGTSFLREADGKVIEIPAHNTINLGIPTFPFYKIEAALSDSLSVVTYQGQTSDAQGPLHNLRVQRHFSAETDPDGSLARLCVADYFIDAQTGLLFKIMDMTHPNDNVEEDLPHELIFANYVTVKGINVPMFVREKVFGQAVWDLQLANVSFNTGLTDLDFSTEIMK